MLVKFPVQNTALCINNFMDYLVDEGYSPRTVESYISALRKTLSGVPDVSEITSADVAKMLANYSGRSLSSRQSALKLFFKWLSLSGVICNTVTAGIPSGASVRKYEPIPEKDVLAIEKALRRLPAVKKAFFTAILELGLKPGEALNLRAEDIDGETVNVRSGSPRKIPVKKETGDLLKSLAGEGFLFKSPRGRYDYTTVYRWWKKLLGELGMDYTLEQLRQVAVRRWKKSGINPVIVRYLAGYRLSEFERMCVHV